MADLNKVDLAVLGAGPGGYAAAFLAADRGLKVALIDASEKLGGACLHVGCSPATIPTFQIDSPRVMDSTGALRLEDVPKSLLVVGGGYIGLELGTVYAALGSRVTVVELTDGLLPGVDRDLLRPLQARLAS